MTDLRAIAEAATPGPWARLVAAGVEDDGGGVAVGRLSDADGAHIAAWYPDRALAALDVIEAAGIVLSVAESMDAQDNAAGTPPDHMIAVTVESWREYIRPRIVAARDALDRWNALP